MEAKLEGKRIPQANVGNKLDKKRKTLQTAMDSALHGVAGGYYGLYIFIHSDVRDFNGISGL